MFSYNAPAADTNQLDEILHNGLRSADFRRIVHWLTEELRVFGKLEEQISAIEDANTADVAVDECNENFVLELSSFLKELQCPFSTWRSGPVAQRFRTPEACTLLLDYLVSELMAMKMSYRNAATGDGGFVIEVVRMQLVRLHCVRSSITYLFVCV